MIELMRINPGAVEFDRSYWTWERHCKQMAEIAGRL